MLGQFLRRAYVVRVQRRLEVDRSVAEVWAQLAPFAGPLPAAVRIPPSSSRWRASRLQVTEWEPTRRLVWETVRGPLPLQVEYTFEPLGEGTQLTVSAELRLSGLWWLVAPVSHWLLRSEHEQSVERLRRVLEDRSSTHCSER